MKVLHLLVSDKFSGAENVAISIIDDLKNDYDFLYVSKKGEIEKILNEKNIPHKLLEKVSLSSVKKIIKEYNPDVIHAHDYIASTLAATSGFKGKIISHLHNDYPFAKKWNAYTLVYSKVSKKFDKIIVVSNAILNNAVFKDKIKAKTIVLNNIVDKERIEKLAKEDNKLGEYDVVFIGRLTDQKNPLAFIKIIKKLTDKKPEIKAVMMGDGELRKACEEKIKELNLENNLTLTGFVENPFPTIKASKCVIMPSKYEGLGLTAVESLILEKPVFFYYDYYMQSGMRDIYGNKKNEFTCKDDNELIENIIGIIENPKNLHIDLKKFTDEKAYNNTIKELYES